MAKPTESVAVFDIGKTNKKLTLYSTQLDAIYSTSVTIGEVVADGFLAEDLASLEDWIRESLDELGGRFSIGAITVTTFGATIALVDSAGQLVFPVLSYNHQPPLDELDECFAQLGPLRRLYVETATPQYGQLLNAGIQLLWLRLRHPDRFRRVVSTLFLPQYISFLLSGRKAVEKTSLGCHTYLLDFQTMGFSSVARKADLVRLFAPEFARPWDVIGHCKQLVARDTSRRDPCKVTAGLHDSSASILPYILEQTSDFVLASTGTCCEFLIREHEYEFRSVDYESNLLRYVDPVGRPVKAAGFKGGEEHDHYTELIRDRYAVDVWEIEYDDLILAQILASADSFVIPQVSPGYGMFARSHGRIVGDAFDNGPSSAYHLLNLSLAVQSYLAVRCLTSASDVRDIYVEGGFAKNTIYLRALSSISPRRRVMVSNIDEATSLGAALCAVAAHQETSPMALDPTCLRFKSQEIPKTRFSEELIENYVSLFEQQIGRTTAPNGGDGRSS